MPMSDQIKTYALDYESYYDKECSIRTLGPLGYFSHPDFDAYLMSVVGDDGFEWVGNPREFDWSMLKGQRVLSHNASFDETLYLFGVKKGWWDSVDVGEWLCTADMVAFCGLPRSLKNSSAELFDLEVSKETRDSMKGKNWDDMDEEFKKEVCDYALKDSVLCLRLWEELKDKWPKEEQEISTVNRRCVQRGLPIDTQLLKQQKDLLTKRLFEAENSIPWIGNAPPLSRKAFNEECRKLNLEPPASLALSSEEANDWIKEHGKKHLWINAVRDFRRINSIKRKLESFDYATLSDDRFYGGCMYFGAHTGRFSGSGGNLNLQNLPRGDMFGANLRHLIAPKKGRKLVVVDLSQIEVRTLCWLAKDTMALEEIREASDIYEVFARRFGVWDGDDGQFGKEEPALRHRVKTMVLGCGYGVGAKKFASIAGMTVRQATDRVNLYRTSMTKVVALWNFLNRRVHVCYSQLLPFSFTLPSGRVMKYGSVKVVLQHDRRQYVVMVNKGTKKIPMKVWGGLLAENLSQALARDIFSYILTQLHKKGHEVILHVHDEVVIECDEEKADGVLEDVLKVMSVPPPWIPDIPLAAEGKILNKYEK